MKILEVIYTNTPWIKSPSWGEVIQQLADKTKEDPMLTAVKVNDWKQKNKDSSPEQAFKALTGEPTAKLTGRTIKGVDLTKQAPEQNGEWIDQGRWWVSKNPILPGSKHEFAIKPDPDDMTTWGPNYKPADKPSTEEPPKPVNGKCPNGWKLSPDGKSCIKDGSTVIPAPADKPADKPADNPPEPFFDVQTAKLACKAPWVYDEKTKACVKKADVPADKPADNPKVKIIYPSGSASQLNTNRPFSLPDHKGIDIKVPVGTDLVAPEAGKITKRHIEKGGAGLYLKLTSTDGLRVHIFMHLSKVYADVGDIVDQGDKIGLTGGAKGDKFAGNSTGPHLHWGIANAKGEYVDPLEFVK